MLTVKHNIVYYDSIQRINKQLIRRFASVAGLLENHDLSNSLYDEFRTWARNFLENFLKTLYTNANLKLYLQPTSLNVNVTYKYGTAQEYENLIQYVPFVRLIKELLQNIVKNDSDYKLSKEGLTLMLHYFVENSIDLFSKININMVDTRKKRVTAEHFNVLKKNN